MRLMWPSTMPPMQSSMAIRDTGKLQTIGGYMGVVVLGHIATAPCVLTIRVFGPTEPHSHLAALESFGMLTCECTCSVNAVAFLRIEIDLCCRFLSP